MVDHHRLPLGDGSGSYANRLLVARDTHFGMKVEQRRPVAMGIPQTLSERRENLLPKMFIPSVNITPAKENIVSTPRNSPSTANST